MIEFKVGDIFDEDADALVNTVNCVGAMGRGIALEFKKKFPENFHSYLAACKRNEVKPGKMHTVETGRFFPRYIINFPTKRHWRDKSRMEDIETGLVALAQEIIEHNIQSIAIPALGSGLGGLHWPEVRQCIESKLKGLDGLKVIVFEPDSGSSARRPAHSFKKPSPSNPRNEPAMHETLFIRGIFQSVLDEILEAHAVNSILTLFLQPYRGDAVALLRDHPPSASSPVRLFLSTSSDVNTISYTATIVGWENKTKLPYDRKKEILTILEKFQPGEGGLYNKSKNPDRPSLNLIHIQNLTVLNQPFGVQNLIKVSDNKPYSPNQSSPGGWSHVRLNNSIEQILNQTTKIP